MKNSFNKNILTHCLLIGIFFVIIYAYFFPVLTGKTLIQTDIIQGIGTIKEAETFQKKTGEEILWSNTSFSGMPVWRGFKTNVIDYFHLLLTKIFPVPVFICILSFIGFYLLLLAYEVNPWLSFAGALAYTFSSFNIISIEAGHINKVFDMALMAPVLAGIVLTFRKRYLYGIPLTILSVALQIFYGHVQITYYLLIIILFYTIGEFIFHLQNKTLKDFVKASLILVICAIIGIAPNISRLWTMSEYSKSTTRGGSELTSKQSKGQKEGLDKDYALSWSYGIMETTTLFIPSVYGGSSHEDLGTDSKTYKTMIRNNVPSSQAKEYIKSMPLYWGDQPFTSGPVYFGAVICFLSVFSFIIIQDRIKWWVLAVSVLAIMLSWGKNFLPLTDIFFNHIPLYNKFRSVTMILTIAQLTFPLLAIVGLQKIITGEITKDKALSGLKIAGIITGGFALFFALLGTSFFNFTSPEDSRYPEWLVDALIEDRKHSLQMSSLRTFVFVLLSATVIWMFIKDKIKATHVYIAFALIILVDLWSIDKKYLDKDDFKINKNLEKKVFALTKADETILKDTDPDYRVLNLSVNPFSDATTSYHHKSIGGYSAIKLGRYQELIESNLANDSLPMNLAVLNMLNTRYIINADKTTNELFVQRNPEALGNAWFVDTVKVVKNADEELAGLRSFNPSTTALVDKRFEAQLKEIPLVSHPAGTIKLDSYHPNRLEYSSNSPSKGLAVFSEIYYNPGWDVFIDGKPAEHLRADYVLRAMVIPEGQHKIKFVFEPKSYYLGEKISLAGSILLVLSLVGSLGYSFYLKRKELNT